MLGRRLRRLGRTGVARAGPVRLRATLGRAQLLAAWAVRARVGWLLAAWAVRSRVGWLLTRPGCLAASCVRF